MPRTSPRLRATASTLLASLALVATLYLLWHTFDPVYDTAFAAAGRGPVFFPRILLAILVPLSVLVLAQSLRSADASDFKLHRLLPVGIAAVATGGYLYLIYVIGYLLASVVFCLALPAVFGYRRWPVIAAFAIVYAASTWFVFEEIFRIVLPKSPWFVAF